ncbi:hypothetical protein [Arthrobacter sp. ISL-69]|uniref:hypothetical protein n=1 Tax=Arthrobacter sp. ISL-69 TaxID=2819113 RepID=UPI001BE79240|nr:hypothetical protein [Arthrobacter sp. ISL-69]MBT2537212.1 hypothetical protein [Arthrobacter sp. ISL-69]
MDDVCDKCGEVHGLCAAHRKQKGGGPCQSDEVLPGGKVCKAHGGHSPQAIRAAQERENRRIVTELYEADPQAAIAAYGVEAVQDPLDMLSRVTAGVLHTMDALGQRVNSLERIRYESEAGGEQIRAELKLYMQAQAQAGKFLDMLIKSGFEERRIKLDEQTAAMFVTAMQRVLARLELTPEQTVLVGTVVPEELRALNA